MNLKNPKGVASVIVVFLGLLHVATGQSRCVNPNRNVGSCTSIYDCSSLFDIIARNQLTASERQFLVNSQCQNGSGRAPYVCCTSDNGYRDTETSTVVLPVVTPTRRVISEPSPSNGRGNILPQPPGCGPLSLADKIYNGNDTALDEYPWMVLLGYSGRNGRITLNCGGSLINQRYVLTAAHCVKGAIEQQIGQLTSVRLGEYDLNNEIDCIDQDCNNKVVEVGIEEAITYPQFNPSAENRHHDIALLRLNRDITYTDFIRPVCLPVASTRLPIDTGEHLIVAGWGRTLLARQSNVKKQLAVPVNDHDTCVRKFSTRNINLITSQICAGGEFAKDSCDGDSGGPLMRQGYSKRWYLEGIVSFGNRCGLEGWPGVYTRVAVYIDWIQQNLRS